MPVSVQAHRHVAVRAFGNLAAFGALDRGGIGAPCAEHEDLSAVVQGIGDLVDEFPGKTARHAPFPPLGDRVDKADFRLLPGVEPFLQVDLDKPPCFSIVQRFQGRGGAAQHDIRLLDDAQHDGAFPRVIARGRRILLVRRVMLLVHDDQPQVVVGEEQG